MCFYVHVDISNDIRVDIPQSYRVNLEDWGIDSIEPGVCENTYENRRLIRNNKARYQAVYRANGDETDLIQVITSEMVEARARLTKEDLLTDLRDINSDFKTGFELIVQLGIEDIVPLWVIAATKEWRRIEKKRVDNPKAHPAYATAPGRCRAPRSDGNRCMMWHGGRVQEDGLCKMHIGTKASDETYAANIQTKARNRLLSASIAATEVLEELMSNATSEPVRAQAAKEILDRSGIRAGMEIEIKGEIEHKPAKLEIQERLEMLAQAAAKADADARAKLETEELEEIELEVLDDDAS